MKKTYIIPEVEIHAISVENLIAQSPTPGAGVDPTNPGTAPSNFEVKGNTQDYDVWDDDWSR